MRNKYIISGLIAAANLCAVAMLITTTATSVQTSEPTKLPVQEHSIRQTRDIETVEKEDIPPLTEDLTTEEVYPEEPPQVVLPATPEEIELLAWVTVAEAEGECEEGKRLVIDTVLNRLDSPRWPNTIREVIYQPRQFVAMENGRAERCKDKITDEIRQLVIEELLCRSNSEVVFFTAGGYGRYGTPLFQVGNHYFCKI